MFVQKSVWWEVDIIDTFSYRFVALITIKICIKFLCVMKVNDIGQRCRSIFRLFGSGFVLSETTAPDSSLRRNRIRNFGWTGSVTPKNWIRIRPFGETDSVSGTPEKPDPDTIKLPWSGSLPLNIWLLYCILLLIFKLIIVIYMNRKPSPALKRKIKTECNRRGPSENKNGLASFSYTVCPWSSDTSEKKIQYICIRKLGLFRFLTITEQTYYRSCELYWIK